MLYGAQAPDVFLQGGGVAPAGIGGVYEAAERAGLQFLEPYAVRVHAAQEGGDLRVIAHADERHALASGEYQPVQAHGDDHLHPRHQPYGERGAERTLQGDAGGIP